MWPQHDYANQGEIGAAQQPAIVIPSLSDIDVFSLPLASHSETQGTLWCLVEAQGSNVPAIFMSIWDNQNSLLRKCFFLKLNHRVFAAKSEQRCIGLMHRGHRWGMFEAQCFDLAVSRDTLQVRIRSRGVTIHRYVAIWDDSRLQQSNPKLHMSLERLWTYQERVLLGSCKNSAYSPHPPKKRNPTVMNYYSSWISRLLQGYLNTMLLWSKTNAVENRWILTCRVVFMYLRLCVSEGLLLKPSLSARLGSLY